MTRILRAKIDVLPGNQWGRLTLSKKLRGALSDQELLSASRSGDIECFAELWDRHRAAGIVAARNIAPSFEPEDIVSDAYTKIFELILDGRGPQDAFRPYLYQVIRTVSVDRLRSPELSTATIDVTELEEFPDLEENPPWEDDSFDLNAVTRAFATLTPRWKAVLWYTEVEGLPPREAAPLLGLSANSTSALAVRAREALQSAWVEAHAHGSNYDEECEFTRKHLQRYQRGKLRGRASREVEEHLESCDDCPAVVAEFTALNKQLGIVLGLIMLGGVGSATLLGKLSLGGAAAGAAGGAGAGAAGAGAASNMGAASGAGGIGGGIGAPAAIISGVVVGALAIVGSVALAVSLLSPPANLPDGGASGGTSGSETSESADSSGSTNGEKNVDATQDDDAHSDKDSDDVLLDETDRVSYGDADNAQNQGPLPGTNPPRQPVPPTTPPVKPTDPVDPGGGTGPGTGPGTGGPGTGPGGGTGGGSYKPAYDTGFECYLEGGGMIGTANKYGVIRLRATAPGGSPIEIMNPRFDPSLEGQPGNGFVNGVFPDLAGNTFDFGFFTGVDNTPALDWFAEDPVQFPEWSTHFPGLKAADVLLEFRLVDPSGNYSSWKVVDASITCP